MSLAPSTRLGPYEILAPLGAGGMGEVYKARDTRLHRLAAIKVLPEGKMADAERRARFIFEAQAASALNHPHIVTIYAIDHDAGCGVDYIAMEFVSGRTLEEAIGRHGMKLEDTLRIGIQIADALAAAHAAGIVHRDLKPGNVMLADNGPVKLLDFGLAKLAEPAENPDDEATRTMRGGGPPTEQGTILGTVSYMSPEQAEGKAVDRRSDIFAFGSVLYEMATGRRAFQGESKMSTLAAILREEPKPAGEAMPRELEKIIARCLRKDVARRFQHIDDVKIALEELKEESESGQLPMGGTAVRHRRVVPGWAIAVTAVVGIAAAAFFYYRARQAVPVADYRMIRLTSDPGLTFYPALSRDGSLLAFASDRAGRDNLDIWVKQIAGGDPIRLTPDSANHSEPSFSPDGANIVFRWEHEGGGLYVMPALGGDPRKIAAGGHNPRFSPDGKWVVYWTLASGGPAVFLVPAMGGAPRRVAPEFTYAQLPCWAGDSAHILFAGRRVAGQLAPGSVDGDDLYVASLGADRPVQTHIWEALQKIGLRAFPIDLAGGTISAPVIADVPRDGPRVLLSVGAGDTANLWEIPLSPKTWQPAGAPERLTFSTGTEAFPAVAASGRMAFANISSKMDLWEVSIGSGKLVTQPARLTADAATNSSPTLAADGKTLGFLSNRSGKIEVWTKDLESGKERALTNDGGIKYRPVMAPDGSSIVYYTPNGLRSVAISGGQPETLCAKCGAPWGWSPDGSLLLYFKEDAGIGLLNTKEGSNREILKHSKYWLQAARFSPDGRWVSFDAVAGANTRRIFVAPFRGGSLIPEADWIPITDGKGMDREARWSPDGNLLYFLSNRDSHKCIWSQRLDAGKHPAGEASAVLHVHGARRNLDVNDTGPIGLAIAPGRVIFAMAEVSGNIWMLQ